MSLGPGANPVNPAAAINFTPQQRLNFIEVSLRLAHTNVTNARDHLLELSMQTNSVDTGNAIRALFLETVPLSRLLQGVSQTSTTMLADPSVLSSF